MSLFILLAIAIILVLLTCLFISLKRNKYARQVIKNYPKQVSALCETLNIHDKYAIRKQILSFNKEYWDDWMNKVNNLCSLSSKFSDVICPYITLYFPYVKNNPLNTSINNFDSCYKYCNTLIECLKYEDILKLSQISQEEWEQKNIERINAEVIKLNNPDAITFLCKQDPNLTNSDIVKSQKRIEQIQLRYNVAAAYDAWLPTQKDFNSLVRDLRDEYAQNCGCYKYDVEFKKPLSSGKTHSEKIIVWQIFKNSTSPYLTEYHSTLSFSMMDNIPEFKARTRYFLNWVYDKIVPYIKATANNKTILVVFNNHSSYNWDKQTYEYHYRYFKTVLSNNSIEFAEIDNLLPISNNFNYDIVFVFDLITTNSDLVYTTKMILESFSTKVSNIVWYSMIKEYDEDEMKSLCSESISKEEKKKQEEKSIDKTNKAQVVEFIKKQILAVNKHPYFSYYAITNTLIGEAANSSDVKPIWLSCPSKYLVESTDKDHKRDGYISIRYSVDGGLSWEQIATRANYEDIDDVALFTYGLFSSMGLIDSFIEKGPQAILHINNKEFLAHR